MATKRLIKNLQSDKNVNIIQSLKTFAFGDKPVGMYKTGKVYTKGDIVIVFDNNINRLHAYKCTTESSNTLWDSSEWIIISAISAIEGIEDFLIVLQHSQPSDTITKLWFNTLDTNSDGSINTNIKVKSTDGSFKTIYPSSIAGNIYMDGSKKNTVLESVNHNMDEVSIIKSIYLGEVLNAVDSTGLGIQSSYNSKFINSLDVSNNTELTISGNFVRFNNVLIL